MQVGRFELNDRRVLAALRFVDAVTGAPAPGLVELVGARAVRNTAGLYVLLAPDPPDTALDDYGASFRTAPAEPAVGSLPLTLTAWPTGPYLARRMSLRLPLEPLNPAAAAFLRRPLAVGLYPAATYPAEATWAVVRAAVTLPGSVPAGGALLRVFSRPATPGEEPRLLGVGLTDGRGEALIAVPTLQVLSLSNPEVTVALEARRDTRDEPGVPADPDALTAAGAGEPWLATVRRDEVVVAPGRTTSAALTFA